MSLTACLTAHHRLDTRRRRAKTLLQASLKEVRARQAQPARTLSATDAQLLAIQGWFNLTRARYHMGSGSVGQLQYDHNMVACVRLSASGARRLLTV